MHPAHYSSLLPEVFRHKTTKVRLFQPQCVLLDFHGTLSERRWEDRVIFPYVRRAVGTYIKDNWSNDTVQRCIPGLRNESFEQRFRHKYEDAPIIDDYKEDEDLSPEKLAEQLGEFLSWQMVTKRETRETQTISRLVWQDGFRRQQIATPLYDDVMQKVKTWHEQYQCSVYVISSIDEETLKLLFEHTDKGNLNQYITGYVCAKRTGDKLISDTYKQFYTTHLSMRGSLKEESKSKSPKAKSPQQQEATNKSTSSPPNSLSKSSLANNQRRSSSITSLSNESLPKPILFLTDSGQEAKAASQVADGLAFECILVNRPGNKRIRSYYLSQFQFVDKFEDIEFV